LHRFTADTIACRTGRRWTRFVASCWLTACAQTALTRAQPIVTPVGSAFQVNVHTEDVQLSGDVLLREDGSFVVVWQSFGQDGQYNGVFSRRFSSAQSGPELQVNEFTLIEQFRPRIAASGDDYLVAWEGWTDLIGPTSRGVVVRSLDATAAPVAGEFVVSPFAIAPAIAGGDGFGFIVASAYGSVIRAHRLGPDLEPISGQLQVNAYTAALHTQPAVALRETGDFAVAWTRSGSADAKTDLFARPFDATGAPTNGGDFLINAHTVGEQGNASVAHRATGELQIVWTSYQQDGDDSGIFARSFASSGSPLAVELQVNARTVGDQDGPRIAAVGDHGFVVVWTDAQVLGSAVVGRLLDPTGQLIGAEFLIAPALSTHQDGARVSALDDGRFVVIWSGATESDPSLSVFARRFRIMDAATPYEVPTLSSSAIVILALTLAAGAWLLLRR
jgi:hypothetical protein